jgi:predicted double-glycine peptidase
VSGFKGLYIDDDCTYVSGVPPIRQDKSYSCGPACVASVAAYWNVSIAEFRAKHAQLADDTNGNSLAALGLDLGLHAFTYQGSMADLKENLGKGRPLIVMISQPLLPDGDITSVLLLSAWNKWGHKPAHWVVVVGTVGARSVIIDDPESGPLMIETGTFIRWWSSRGNLCVLMAPKQGPALGSSS